MEDFNGAKRYTISKEELNQLYKNLENFIADCTFQEYQENKEAISNVLSLIHKHLRYGNTEDKRTC